MRKLLLLLQIFIISGYCLAQQSLLYPDFGKNGKIAANFDNKNNELYTPHAILVTDSNSILTGGYIGAEYMLHKIKTTGKDDLNFGFNGFRFFDYGTVFNNRLEEIIKYPGGKTILIGNISPAVSVVGKYTSLMGSSVIRLLPDGNPDTSFGIKGKVFITIPFFNFWPATAVVQPDGKIIIAARASLYDAALILDRPVLFRLNADGSLDNSFGTQGIFFIPQQGLTPVPPSPLMGLALQPDGKIILGDITAEPIFVNGGSGLRNSPAVFRIKPNGVLDSTFGVNGRFLNRFGYNDYQIRSLIVQTDGKILVAGNTFTTTPSVSASWLMFRLNSGGQVDSSFAINGIFTRSVPGSRISAISAIRPAENDRIMVAAFHDNFSQGFMDVFKLKLNGTFDSTFAQSAIIYQKPFLQGHFFENLKMDMDTAMNPTILGYSTYSVQFTGHMILRLTKNGQAITEFNGTGIETYTNSQGNQNLADYSYGSSDKLVGITQFSNGKILMAGNIFQDPNDTRQKIGLVKLTADGKIDSSFGTTGRKAVMPDNNPAVMKAFLKLDDEKIIINRNANTLVKIDSTGKIDSSFGTNGVLILNLPDRNGFPTEIRALAQQMDKKILVLSTNKIYRLHPDGQPDNTFGSSGSITLFLNNDGIGQKIGVQTDGKIVAAIQDGNGVQMFRCSATGVADNSFGIFNNGYQYVNVNISLTYELPFKNVFTDFEILPDGKVIILCMKERFAGIPSSNNNQIIAAGANYRDIILYRINTNGSIDQTFGGIPNQSFYRGTSHLSLPFVEEVPGDLSITQNGKILIAGFFNRGTGWDIGLVQLKANGLYDTTCFIKGFVTAGQNDVLQREGKLFILPLQNGTYLIAGTQLGQGADFFGVNFIAPNSPVVNYIQFDATPDTACFKANLAWTTDQECNIDSFYIEHSRDSISFTRIGSKAATGNTAVSTFYQFSHLTAFYGNNYYRLRLFAGGSSTPFVSDTKKVVIDNSPLGVITWQDISYTKRDSVFDVQLKWQILDEIRTSAIQLQISTDSINYQTIQTIPAGGTVSGVKSYVAAINNLNPGKYYFRLLLAGDNCRTYFSDTSSVILKGCSEKLLVYPNPVRSTLTVKLPQCEPGDLRIINAMGQTMIIMRQVNSGSDIEIDCRKMAAGVYFLQFIGRQSRSVAKFEKL
jgi:uncharacterized delta-60 repeat protein